MTKVVRFHKAGDANVLRLENITLEEPKGNEVRICVKAIALNRAEIMFRRGAYIEDPVFPARIGYEAAGVIDAIGSEVSKFKVGDKVSTFSAFSMNQYGVYGEKAIVPEVGVASFPGNLSFEQGASIWMSYLTAYGALKYYAGVKSGDFVLITAATSSIGYGAIQLAKAAGATVIATTRTSAKKQRLFDAGADYAIATEEEDLANCVDEITRGKGTNIIFDAIAGPLLNDLAKAAAIGATIFIYGALDSESSTPYPVFLAVGKGLKIRGYTLGELQQNLEAFAQAKNYIYQQLKLGVLQTKIDSQTFSLDRISEAHLYMESNQQQGKIIIKI